jgi:two-component system response regulator ChvI
MTDACRTLSMTDVRTADPPPPAEVAVVDDDRMFLQTLVGNLNDAGVNAIALEGGAAALDFFDTGGRAGALVLDWQMPEIDGPELLQRLRSKGNMTPALFLTGLTQPIYEERGLKLGAVDFIEKAKSFAVILQRVKVVLGGAKTNDEGGVPPVETHGALELNHDHARALWKGEAVPLTLSEFKVVSLLVSRRGGDVPYRAIYDVVRGEGFRAGSGDEGYRANVRALIKRVRQKFRDIDADFSALDNYAGFGYRWIDQP